MSEQKEQQIPIAILIGEGSRLKETFRRMREKESNLKIVSVISHKSLKDKTTRRDVCGITWAKTLDIHNDYWNYARMAKMSGETETGLDSDFRRKFSQFLGLYLRQSYTFEPPQGIALIGWRIVLTKEFLSQFPGSNGKPYNVINLHPALMPDSPYSPHYTPEDGLRLLYVKGNKEEVLKAVFDMKLTKYGATMHFVTDNLDYGPIIARAEIEIDPTDTPESYDQEKLDPVENKMVADVLERFGANSLD